MPDTRNPERLREAYPVPETDGFERVSLQMRLVRDAAQHLVEDIDRFKTTLSAMAAARVESRTTLTPAPQARPLVAALPSGVMRIGDVTRALGICRSTVYRLIQDGAFPVGVRLSTRAVGWKAADIEAWLSARIAQSERSAKERRR